MSRRYLFCVLWPLRRTLFLCFGGRYSCGSTHGGPPEHPIARAAQQRTGAPLRVDAQLERQALAVEDADATSVPLTFAPQWAPRVVSAVLDVTTINQFYAQMPPEETLTPSHRRAGGLLFVNWEFDDASYIEAAFASVPGDMVLDHLSMDSVTMSQLRAAR